MSVSIETLIHEIEKIKVERDFYKQKSVLSGEEVDRLMNYIKELKRIIFGCKSEKFIHPGQENLPFEESPFNEAPQQEENNNVVMIEPYQRRKRNKKNQRLIKRVIVIPVSINNRTCHCGACKKLIRYEVTEYFNYVAPCYEIIEEKREILGCPNACEKSIVMAEKPKRILPKVGVSESFLAYLITSKINDRQPLYHLEKKLQSQFGIYISRQSMAKWFVDLYQPLLPIYNLLKDYLIDYDIASLDATTLQVLNEPGRPATRKSYAYCFRGGTKYKGVILYDYNEKNHKIFVKNWFEGFCGYIHADADPFFDLLTDGNKVVYCNSHARRNFEKITKDVTKEGLAHQAMKIYQKLYRVERKAKREEMSEEQRYQLRLQYSKPIIVEFKQWLDQH